jgi:hypothetical protein
VRPNRVLQVTAGARRRSQVLKAWYFLAQWQPNDKLWRYHERAPPGINTGELGVALVPPIEAMVTWATRTYGADWACSKANEQPSRHWRQTGPAARHSRG